MSELGLSLVDIVLVMAAISVAFVCVLINLYSSSKKERETQFHELQFIASTSKAVANKNTPNSEEFEA